MRFLRHKLPLLSLSLLFFTYSVFGWLLSSSTVSWQLWLAALGLVLLIDLTLAAPLKLFTFCFSSLLGSDARAFISIILFAFGAVMILTWLSFFARFFVLVSAGALARLDLQTAGYNEGQAVAMLTVICVGGYGLGLVANLFI